MTETRVIKCGTYDVLEIPSKTTSFWSKKSKVKVPLLENACVPAYSYERCRTLLTFTRWRDQYTADPAPRFISHCRSLLSKLESHSEERIPSPSRSSRKIVIVVQTPGETDGSVKAESYGYDSIQRTITHPLNPYSNHKNYSNHTLGLTVM